MMNDQWFKHIFLLKKRVFSKVLERAILKSFFLGGSPRPQRISERVHTYIFLHHIPICLDRLSHDKISTFKIKVLCLPYLCKIDWPNEKQLWKILFLRKRTFSNVLERVIIEIFWGQALDPQLSLKEVETLVREKCLSVDDLYLKTLEFERMLSALACHSSLHFLFGSSRPDIHQEHFLAPPLNILLHYEINSKE